MTIVTRSKKNLPLLGLLCAVSSLFGGCQYHVEDPCSERSATYNASVASIFNAHCASCHGGTFPEAGLALDDFESATDATLSGDVLYRISLPATDPLAMPPNGSFGSCDAALIKKWASLGAPEFQ